MEISLRDRQIESIVRMVRLNHDGSLEGLMKGIGRMGWMNKKGEEREEEEKLDDLKKRGLKEMKASKEMDNEKEDMTMNDLWKILILDKSGRDIISPLLKVNELREQGVTLHLMLHSGRERIPDTPAVYFVDPTKENIERIVIDLKQGLYDQYYLNFTSSLPRTLLEDLVNGSVETKAARKIAKVYDQYVDFLSLEANLFTLNEQQSYVTLNNPKATDVVIEETIDRIANHLFSVITTLGVVPVIRCPKGNAAELVAQKLENRLRDHILNNQKSHSGLFRPSQSSSLSLQEQDLSGLRRPVLIILDRNIDLTTIFHHTWTYQALVHDVLQMNLNRVIVETTEDGERKKKTYDLDAKDFFWKKNAGNPFPKVAEDVDAELNAYKQSVEEVNKLSSAEALIDTDAHTKGLRSALIALPELTDKKRIIDMHMNIATSLLHDIKNRQLDNYFALEETITRQSKSALLDFIKNQEKGLPEDKLRLFIIYYLSTEEISASDLEEYEQALLSIGCHIQPMKYLRKLKSYSKMTSLSSVGSNMTNIKSSADFLAKFTTLHTKFTENLKEGRLMDGAVEMLRSGVRNLLPPSKDLPVTKIVDSLMEMKSTPDLDDFLYFDPKQLKKTDGRTLPKSRLIFHDAIVFLVGGGNYMEYQNLQDYAQRQSIKKNICYGVTELVNAHQFLEQLNQLGNAQTS